jgi:transposase-like protein
MYHRCTAYKDARSKKIVSGSPCKFNNAKDCTSYTNAKQELINLEKWLESNPSVAKSLIECREELLTMHQLNVPLLLQKTLYFINPIESMFPLTDLEESKL